MLSIRDYLPRVPQSDQTRVVEAKFVAAAQTEASLPPPVLLEVVFAGRSNVGKSSLLNCMLERKNLVRTSSTPGCTRQINFYEARLADQTQLYLVDLPGFGYAKRSKAERKAWAQLIEGYLATRVSLAAIVILVDVRRGPEAEELELAEFVAHTNTQRGRPISMVWVATKLDKVPNTRQKAVLSELKAKTRMPLLGFSAKDATGREAIWRAVRRALSLEAAKPEAATPEAANPEPGASDA